MTYDIKNLNFEKLEKATPNNTPVNILEYDFNKLLEKNIEFSTKLAKIIKDKGFNYWFYKTDGPLGYVNALKKIF